MVKLLADVKASPKLAKVINVFTTEKFAQALTQRRKDAEALGKAFDPRQARGYDAQWIADGQEKIMRVLNSPHVVAYGFKAPQTAKFCKPAASENRLRGTPKLAIHRVFKHVSGGCPARLISFIGTDLLMKNKIASSRYIVILLCGSNHRPAGQDHTTMKNNFCNTPVALCRSPWRTRTTTCAAMPARLAPPPRMP